MAKALTRREFLQTAGSIASTVLTSPLWSAPLAMEKQILAKIPSTGELLPRVGLGTYSTFDVSLHSAEMGAVREVVAEFFRLGGRLVDSSPMYGAAEEVTGVVSVELGINRNLFLATKVWTSGATRGREQMAESLRRMGRSKLELMQIHNLVDWRTQLKALRDGKEKGTYRYIGLTHYMTSAFDELARILKSEQIDFLQIPYSLGETAAEQKLLGVAADRAVAVIANEPFGQGRLFTRVRGKTVPAWAQEKGIRSWGEYFLKFILAEPRVQFVIPATRRLAHLRDNMAAGVGYMPDRAERERMRREF